MTIKEAEHILTTLYDALDDTRYQFNIPISSLKGHGITEVTTATKLRFANEFLHLSFRVADPEKRIADAIDYYHETRLLLVFSRFVPDDQVNTKCATSPYFPYDQSDVVDAYLNSTETISSFCQYCLSVGAEDPIYWQKIYTRMGLEYTSASPRSNEPVFLKLGGTQ